MYIKQEQPKTIIINFNLFFRLVWKTSKTSRESPYQKRKWWTLWRMYLYLQLNAIYTLEMQWLSTLSQRTAPPPRDSHSGETESCSCTTLMIPHLVLCECTLYVNGWNETILLVASVSLTGENLAHYITEFCNIKIL